MGRLLLFKLGGGTVNCEELDLMGFDFDIFICQIAAGFGGEPCPTV